LLGAGMGNWSQPCAGPAGENESLHGVVSSRGRLAGPLRLPAHVVALRHDLPQTVRQPSSTLPPEPADSMP
jgi:hypothetical protein